MGMPALLLRLLLLVAAVHSAQAGDAEFTIAGLRLMPDRWNKAADRGAEMAVAPEGFLEG
jgi:hypothetical protein